MIRIEYDGPHTKGSLYNTVDKSAVSIVEAEYREVPGFETNADVCAVPMRPSLEDIISLATTDVPGYDRDAVAGMTKQERREQILIMDMATCILDPYFDLADAIFDTLSFSMMNRETRKTESMYAGKGGIACSIHSVRSRMAVRPRGFFMYGGSGAGKSVGLSLITSMIPEAVHHSYGIAEYIQIPVIRVTALEANLGDVFRSFAKRLDEILDTDGLHYSKVEHKNPGKMVSYIRNWIKLYHIGLLIIDEIQFLSINSTQNSIENIVSLSEDTGIAIGMIGNLEAYSQIMNNARLYGRIMGHIINVDARTISSEEYFRNAVQELWKYQWTDEYVPLNNAILQALLDETGSNINLLKLLLMKLQLKAVATGTHPDTTMIHEICGGRFLHMRDLISRSDRESEQAYKNEVSCMKEEIEKEARTAKSRNRLAALEQSRELLEDPATKALIAEVCGILDGQSDQATLRQLTYNTLKEHPSLRTGSADIVAATVNRFLDKERPEPKKRAKAGCKNTDAEQSIQKLVGGQP